MGDVRFLRPPGDGKVVKAGYGPDQLPVPGFESLETHGRLYLIHDPIDDVGREWNAALLSGDLSRIEAAMDRMLCAIRDRLPF